MHTLIDRVIHLLLFLEAQLHLGRMDIDVDLFPADMEMEHRKRKFVLHDKIPVGILQRFGDHGALHISSVYEEVLEITVAPGDDRFSEITADLEPALLKFHFQQIGGHISSVDIVDHVL